MGFTTLALFLSLLVASGSVSAEAAKGSNQPTAPNHAPAPVLGKTLIRFTECTDEREQVIRNAVLYANKTIERANRYFQRHSYEKRGKAYTTYFGESSPKDYQAVLLRFENMAKEVTSVNYNCKPCKREKERDPPPTIFTNDNDPTVQLCVDFWEQPGDRIVRWITLSQLKDKDALTKFQAGWIIHALSQFGDVGGIAVKDFHWDISNAKGFAADKPAKVARSAGNYMYFAKNIPGDPRFKKWHSLPVGL